MKNKFLKNNFEIFFSKNEKDFTNLAEKIFIIYENLWKEKIKNKNSPKSFLIFLEGDMGSGKTTFTKYFAKVLQEKENINSPTFMIRKDYEKFIHLDGYRIEDKKEVEFIKLKEEIENSFKIILIEWPDKFVEYFEDIKDFVFIPDLILKFSYDENVLEERKIEIIF